MSIGSSQPSIVGLPVALPFDRHAGDSWTRITSEPYLARPVDIDCNALTDVLVVDTAIERHVPIADLHFLPKCRDCAPDLGEKAGVYSMIKSCPHCGSTNAPRSTVP